MVGFVRKEPWEVGVAWLVAAPAKLCTSGGELLRVEKLSACRFEFGEQPEPEPDESAVNVEPRIVPDSGALAALLLATVLLLGVASNGWEDPEGMSPCAAEPSGGKSNSLGSACSAGWCAYCGSTSGRRFWVEWWVSLGSGRSRSSCPVKKSK